MDLICCKRRNAIKEIKHSKATGTDGVSMEMIEALEKLGRPIEKSPFWHTKFMIRRSQAI